MKKKVLYLPILNRNVKISRTSKTKDKYIKICKYVPTLNNKLETKIANIDVF